MRKITKHESELMLLQIKTVYPNFNLTDDVANIWIPFLMEADAEMAVQNLKDHIKSSKYPPTIHEIVKENEYIKAKRDKENTQKRLQEERLMLAASSPPPWEREGLTQREWMARILAERRA